MDSPTFSFTRPERYTCLRCSRRIISPLDDLIISADLHTLCLRCYNHHVAHREESLRTPVIRSIYSTLYALPALLGEWLDTGA